MGIRQSISKGIKFRWALFLLIIGLVLTIGIFTGSAGAASSCNVDLDDTTSPTRAGLTVASVSSRQVVLTWSGASDDRVVTGFRLFRNDREIASFPFYQTLYIDSGLNPSTSYTYTLYDYDAAGNKNASTLQVTTTSVSVMPLQILATGREHTLGVLMNGAVLATGRNDFGQCNVISWKDIVQVAGGGDHSVGLTKYGTVVSTGLNDKGQCNVSAWNNIIQISAGRSHTVGLRKDGTVVAIGDNSYGQCTFDPQIWSNIVQIAVGYFHTVGLKSDGSVVAVGDSADGQCNVTGTNWKNIIQISAGLYHTVGLKQDHTVVAVGGAYHNNGQCNTTGSDWSNITQVSAGHIHTVGLKPGNTAVAVGYSTDFRCAVTGSTWKNIILLAAGGNHTIALQSTGTMLSTGANDYGQLNVTNWYLFDNTPPTNPVVSASIVSNNQVNLSWTASSDPGGKVKGYNIYRNDKPGKPLATTTALNYSDTGLMPASYIYKVTACDYALNESTGAEVVAEFDTTPPSVPANLQITVASASQVNLTWTAATDKIGVTGYKLYRNLKLLIDLGNKTSYSNTGLDPAQWYAYAVSAYDAAKNESSRSIGKTVKTDTTPPGAPTGLTATGASGTSIKLTWQAASDPKWGIKNYFIYRNGTRIGETTAAIYNYTDIGLLPLTSYTYEVSAYDVGNNEGPRVKATGTTKADTTPPGAPGLKAVVAGNSVNLSWKTSDDIGVKASYLYRNDLGAKELAILSPDVTSYVDSGLKPGDYTYKVVVYDTSNNKTESSATAKVLDVTPPTAPVLSFTVSGKQVTLTWTAATDDSGVVKGYRIYRNNTKIKDSTDTNTLAYTETLASRGPYAYQVGAYDAANNEAKSNTVSDTSAPTAPVLLDPVVSGDQVTLTWNSSSDDKGVLGYDIYINNGSIYMEAKSSPWTYTVNAGGTYNFQVEAYDLAYNKTRSNLKTVSVKLLPPKNLTVEYSTFNRIALVWDPSRDPGVTKYRIYRNDEIYWTIPKDSHFIVDSSVLPKTTYKYQVSAFGTNESDLTNAVTVTTPDHDTLPPTTPTGLKAILLPDNQVSLSWEAATDNVAVEGYTLYRDAMPIFSTAGNEISAIDDVFPAAIYTYRVTAFDHDNNFSDFSSGVSVTSQPGLQAGIAAGQYHTIGLRFDGTVTAVGDNTKKQCTFDANWTDIVQVAAGALHSVGLKKDGTVLAVGADTKKQVSAVSAWKDMVQIAAGQNHTVGLKKDGTVIGVGDNTKKQCTFDTNWKDILQIAAGQNHTVGLKKDGTVLAAGDDSKKQCSNVSAWQGKYLITQVAAGQYHTVGLCLDGTVVAVGDNNNKQCTFDANWKDIVWIGAGQSYTVGLKKNGTVVATGSTLSTPVKSWQSIQQIAAGYAHIIGLQKTGLLVSAGDNTKSQCNVGIWRLTTVPHVAAGWRHIVGLRNDGMTLAVGDNSNNQCVVFNENTVQIAAGQSHSVGLLNNGKVWAVGYRDNGQCDVNDWENIVQVAAGGGHTIGLKNDGMVMAAGYPECYTDVNGNDVRLTWQNINITQVAAGAWHTVGLTSQNKVVTTGSEDVSGWSNIVQIAAGEYFTVGLTNGKKVVTTREEDSAKVSGWSNIVQIAAGFDFAVGLTANNTVLTTGSQDLSEWKDIVWIAAGGDAIVGLRKDGTVVTSNDGFGRWHVEDWNLFDMILHRPQVTVGGFYEGNNGGSHTVGLKKNGTVVAVGRDRENQCGDVFRFSGNVQIAAGQNYTIGLLKDGRIGWIAGLFDYADDIRSWRNLKQIASAPYHLLGLLNNGRVIADPDMFPQGSSLSDWENIVQVAAGYYHAVGLQSDGYVVATGDSDSGQCQVSDRSIWYNIVQIAAGGDLTAGLRGDNTIVVTCDCANIQNDLTNWNKTKDIVQIATNGAMLFGLKKNGTVVATSFDGQSNGIDISKWTGIVQILAGDGYVVGLRLDGSVITAGGENEYGECNVADWNLN